MRRYELLHCSTCGSCCTLRSLLALQHYRDSLLRKTSEWYAAMLDELHMLRGLLD